MLLSADCKSVLHPSFINLLQYVQLNSAAVQIYFNLHLASTCTLCLQATAGLYISSQYMSSLAQFPACQQNIVVFYVCTCAIILSFLSSFIIWLGETLMHGRGIANQPIVDNPCIMLHACICLPFEEKHSFYSLLIPYVNN